MRGHAQARAVAGAAHLPDQSDAPSYPLVPPGSGGYLRRNHEKAEPWSRRRRDGHE